MEHRKILFLILSAIHFVPSPLSYSKTRSLFTPEQRLQQTIKTIQSIRTKVPDAQIVFIELGTSEVLSGKLKPFVNRYIYLGNNRIVRRAVDSPYKGLGEAVGLLIAHQYIENYQADYYFKISGRYRLNAHFHLEDWIKEGFSAKMANGWMSTRLYGFSKNDYDHWRTALKRSVPLLRHGKALESVLPRCLGRIRRLKNIGVSGTIAPWNKKVSE